MDMEWSNLGLDFRAMGFGTLPARDLGERPLGIWTLWVASRARTLAVNHLRPKNWKCSARSARWRTFDDWVLPFWSRLSEVVETTGAIRPLGNAETKTPLPQKHLRRRICKPQPLTRQVKTLRLDLPPPLPHELADFLFPFSV